MAKVYVGVYPSRVEDGPPFIEKLVGYGHRVLGVTLGVIGFPDLLLTNVRESHVIITLTHDYQRGNAIAYQLGIEIGAAVALEKPLYVIGSHKSDFRDYRPVIHYRTPEEFLDPFNGEWRRKGGWRAADDPPRLPGTYSLWVAPGVPHEARFDGGNWAVDPHTFIYGWFDPMFVGFARIPPLITFGDK